MTSNLSVQSRPSRYVIPLSLKFTTHITTPFPTKISLGQENGRGCDWTTVVGFHLIEVLSWAFTWLRYCRGLSVDWNTVVGFHLLCNSWLWSDYFSWYTKPKREILEMTSISTQIFDKNIDRIEKLGTLQSARILVGIMEVTYTKRNALLVMRNSFFPAALSRRISSDTCFCLSM